MDDREARIKKNFSSIDPDDLAEGVEILKSMEYRVRPVDPAVIKRLSESMDWGLTARPPERIPRILSKIQAIWERYPDMRFGQLLANLFPKYESNLFHPEDDRLEQALDEFQNF